MINLSCQRFLAVCLFVTSCARGFSQDVVFEKEIKLRTGLTGKGAFTHPVTCGDEKVLFLIDRKTITALRFNKQFELTHEVVALRPDNTDYDLVGTSVSNDIHSIYYYSRYSRKIQQTLFNFTANTSDTKIIPWAAKKAKYISGVSYQGKMYMLSAIKDGLRIHTFDGTNVPTEYNYAFPDKDLQVPGGLDELVKKQDIFVIDNEAPTSLGVASEKVKLYTYDNKIVLTIDQYFNRTAMIEIELSSMTHNLTYHRFPSDVACLKSTPADPSIKMSNSNSYIHNGFLYQVNMCPEIFAIAVKNMKTNEVVQTYKVDENSVISFKNSPIQQEKGSSDRELSKTSQFLRKASYAKAGIFTFASREGVVLTIGSSKEISTGGGPMMGGGMGMPSISTPYGVIPGTALNPTFYGFQSYATMTKDVYFQSLLSPNTFEHRPGSLPRNPFDSIEEFSDKKEEDIKAKTVFRQGDVFYLAYYYSPDKKFYIRRFVD